MSEPGRNLSQNGQVMRRNRQTGEWEEVGQQGYQNSLRTLGANATNNIVARVNRRIIRS